MDPERQQEPGWDPDAPIGMTGREFHDMLEAMAAIVRKHAPVRADAIIVEWFSIPASSRPIPSWAEDYPRRWAEGEPRESDHREK